MREHDAPLAVCQRAGVHPIGRELLPVVEGERDVLAVRLAVRPPCECLVELARSDPSPAVRSQLACTAKRLPGSDALPIHEQLIARAEDANDPHIPLLIWWALEDKALTDQEQVVKLFTTAQTWRYPLVEKTVLERIGRRYAEQGGTAGLSACARLQARARW